MIRLHTLGTLDVTIDGAAAPADLLWKKNIGLLLYLARAPRHRCTREQLIGLLWPDKDDGAARQSMREALRALRHHVGDDRLDSTGDVIQLRDGAVDLDTDRLEQLVKQRDWAQTTPLINGEFVEGFKIPDASGFEDWLTVERSHWHGLAMDALLHDAEARIDAGDEGGGGADSAIAKARKLDPLSQRALRAHMRRLALADDRTGALRVFEDFGETVLEPETRTLVERLRNARTWHHPKAAQAERGG
jgi:DNA-binding SARP family transcriptional activator